MDISSLPRTALAVSRIVLVPLAAVLAMVVSLLAPPSSEAADAALPAADGLTEETAAASCWEIAQNDPDSEDGSYWLLTPAMTKAEQFYCDQSRAGGGWVLVGRGREDWSVAVNGSGTPAQVRTVVDGPGAFTPRQLPGEMIDDLNNDADISELDDGVRLVRATNQAGTSHQEVTFTFESPRQEWTWMFNSQQRVGSYTIDATTRSGGRTTDFGFNNGFGRVRTITGATEGWMMGFGYGSSVRGDPSSTSHLWSRNTSTGYARPFTQVFIRPKLMSSEVFEEIPDSGSPAITGEAVVDSFALPQVWGVAGLGAGPASIEGSNEVSAFTEVGDRVFVGGNFTRIQRTSSSSGAVQQSYLTAFDRDSGELVSNFTPTFDNQVKALAPMPGGRIAVGGYFSQVNGQSHPGLVVLDAGTGQIDQAFTGRLINYLSGGVPVVRALDVQDGWLYVGGTFTHGTGGTATQEVYGRAGIRFSVADGTPDITWNPEFNGTVISLDASDNGDRTYFAGYFSQSRGRDADKAAALSTQSEDLFPWQVHFSNRIGGRAGYQQAVLEVGDRVWLGGSEHSLVSYSRDDFQMLSSSIGQVGGDFQAIATDGNVVYGGCHCFESQYEGALYWPGVGTDWTESHHIYGTGAWSASTGDRIPSFAGSFYTRAGAGAWATFVDSSGVLWQGGDYTHSVRSGYVRQWSGGFVRHEQRDTSPPTMPSGATAEGNADGVEVSWSTSNDDREVTGYQVLRHDRVVATVADTSVQLSEAPADTNYFVRAIDARGNASASTQAITASPAPEVPDTTTLISAGAAWSYLYDGTAPDEDWTTPEFDDSDWTTGQAPLGWGHSDLGTELTTTVTPTPLVSFHRRTFDIDDASVIETLELTTRADDGIVIHINGTEVARQHVDDGPVDANTYANTPVSASQALANPLTITVPGHLITTGTNVITTSVHSNWRSTPSHSFELEATATLGTQPPEPPVQQEAAPAPDRDAAGAPEEDPAPAPEQQRESVPQEGPEQDPQPVGEQERHSAPQEETEPAPDEEDPPSAQDPESVSPNDEVDTVTESASDEDVTRELGRESENPPVISADAVWTYHYGEEPVPADWHTDEFDDSEWESGSGVFGWGHDSIDTPLDTSLNPRPITSYYRHAFTLEEIGADGLTLITRADDGVVIYLNGEEIARENLDDGAVTEDTYALRDVPASTVDEEPLIVAIAGSDLRPGENVISVEVHSSEQSTSSHSFALIAEEA